MKTPEDRVADSSEMHQCMHKCGFLQECSAKAHIEELEESLDATVKVRDSYYKEASRLRDDRDRILELHDDERSRIAKLEAGHVDSRVKELEADVKKWTERCTIAYEAGMADSARVIQAEATAAQFKRNWIEAKHEFGMRIKEVVAENEAIKAMHARIISWPSEDVERAYTILLQLAATEARAGGDGKHALNAVDTLRKHVSQLHAKSDALDAALHESQKALTAIPYDQSLVTRAVQHATELLGEGQ